MGGRAVESARRVAALRQMAADGIGITAAARSLDISTAHAAGLAERHGIAFAIQRRGIKRRIDVPAKDAALIVELYARGLSMVIVAEQSGYSEPVVRRALLASGVTIRRHGERVKKAGRGTTPHRPGTHVRNSTLHAPHVHGDAP